MKESFYQDILDNLNIGIYIVDCDGNYIYVNDSMTSITGAKKEEILGSTVYQHLQSDSMSESVSMRVVVQKAPLNFVQYVKTPYKSYRQLVRAKPHFLPGGQVDYVVVEVTVLDDFSRYYQQALLAESYPLGVISSMDDEEIICFSSQMKAVFETADKLALSDAPILLTGETGSGKDVLARYIYRHSKRKNKKMVSLNCAAIPSALLESELFGYEKGAFTGASAAGKTGILDQVDGGTLFLDEINSMPLDTQAKLLKVLETKKYMRIGSAKERGSDFRLISATNASLAERVKMGEFRSDLFYRISTLPVHVPPLRDRKDDVVPMAIFFCNLFSTKYQQPKVLTPQLLSQMESYRWPGNVRQLRNAIERLVVMTPADKVELTGEDFSLALRDDMLVPGQTEDIPKPQSEPSDGSLKHQVEAYERQILAEAFQKYKSSYEVAVALKTPQSTIMRKKQKYHL